MTGIFTGFNPTKPACDPIANPKPPKNKPKVLGAKDATVITTSVIGALPTNGIGAPSFIDAESSAGVIAPSALSAESKANISAPTELSAESGVNIAAPSNLGAELKPDINAPVNKTAESKPDVSAPSTTPAKAAATIAVPSEKTARPKKTVSTPSNLGAEDAAAVSAPSSKTARPKKVLSAPSNVGAESAIAVPVPSSKTAAAKPVVSAPSSKSAVSKPDIDAPSNLDAEAKASIAAPSSKTAIAKPDIDAPSNLGAEAKAAISNPLYIAAQNYGTNLLTYSEQFDNAAWGKTSGTAVTPNTVTSPDGTLSADTFDANSSNFGSITQPVSASGLVTFSYFVKKGTSNIATIRVGGVDIGGSGVTNSTYEFNLDTATFQKANGSDGVTKFKALANGWYRVSLTISTTSVTTVWIGTNFLPPSEGTIYVWGAQLEESSSLNQYTKTEATPITVASSADKPTVASAEARATIDTPSASAAQPQAAIATPSSLTANPATAVTPPFPLNHARILYENVLQGYNSITDTGPTGTAINAIKPNTWERWKFSTAANTLIIDFSTAVDFDTVCIASHNLSNAGATIAVYYEPEPGGVFLELDTKTPTNNEPICFYSETLLDALTIEIRITGASGVPQIGYVSAGESLQMQRPFFNGHIPITDGDVTEYYSNRTESGEIIGQHIRRQGYQTTADWRYIDDTWYRTYFDPFKKAAKLTPFFFMWNLLEYPDDVGFCRISQDINSPMQNGFTAKRTISMTLLGAG